ncbi:MAG TPA: hypothetical protein VMT50_05565 [Steroidobacteraceae bacterium]|nr:hypothetical protein [Steroidobacteraceae bacterium]
MPTPAVLFAGLLFGCAGLGIFLYGRKQAKFVPLLGGLLLMVLPYLIDEAWLLYASGLAIGGALFWFRE